MPSDSPLYSREAEQAVFSILLINNALIKGGVIEGGDFFVTLHQKWYSIISQMVEDGEPVDLITLGVKLPANEIVKLSEYCSISYPDLYFEKYASIIKDYSNKRKVQKGILEIASSFKNLSYADIQEKLKSLTSDNGYHGTRKRGTQGEVERFIDDTRGVFSVADCFKAIQELLPLQSPQELQRLRNAVRISFSRFAKEGLIERDAKRSGWYRKIERKVESIDIFGDEDKPINLFWPLGIESMVRTMPKSIIIVAGEPDSGKTGFLLNFSMMNMGKHKLNYFSSEMGATELKDRISKFRDDGDIKEWKTVNFFERSDNFSDVIIPESINIIDYLELHDEFFKVGGQIKDIFDKLTTGIAIIALQKKTGSDLARGGDFTMEKARLYVSLSKENVCKIIKAKNWVSPMVKPAGKQRKYALYKGCQFHPKSNWTMEGQENEQSGDERDGWKGGNMGKGDPKR
jgi:hypothetical protein